MVMPEPLIEMTTTGSSKRTDSFLQKMLHLGTLRDLEQYAKTGIAALEAATPSDSGETAKSWVSEVSRKGSSYSISWHNTNMTEEGPVVIFIQYGHATRNGGWIEGRDFINPVLQPLFDQIVNNLWDEVTNG